MRNEDWFYGRVRDVMLDEFSVRVVICVDAFEVSRGSSHVKARIINKVQNICIVAYVFGVCDDRPADKIGLKSNWGCFGSAF